MIRGVAAKQRQMNRRTFKLRMKLENRMTLHAEPPFWDRWTKLPEYVQATHLVIQSDITLALLIDALFRGVDDRQAQRRNARLLARAHRDEAHLERAWVFLAHAVARDCAARPGDDWPRVGAAMQPLLDAHFPPEDSDRMALDHGPRAHLLGLGTPPILYARHSVDVLLGPDDSQQLGVDFNNWSLEPLLDLWWRQSLVPYRNMVLRGAHPGGANEWSPADLPPAVATGESIQRQFDVTAEPLSDEHLERIREVAETFALGDAELPNHLPGRVVKVVTGHLQGLVRDGRVRADEVEQGVAFATSCSGSAFGLGNTSPPAPSPSTFRRRHTQTPRLSS